MVKIRLRQKDPTTVLLGSLHDLPATFSFVSLNEVGVGPCCIFFFCRKQTSEAVIVISNYMSLDFLRISYVIVKLQYDLSEKSFVFLEGQQLD